MQRAGRGEETAAAVGEGPSKLLCVWARRSLRRGPGPHYQRLHSQVMALPPAHCRDRWSEAKECPLVVSHS